MSVIVPAVPPDPASPEKPGLFKRFFLWIRKVFGR